LNGTGVDALDEAHRRVERLYEIGKRLVDFKSVEGTLADILAMVAEEIPLQSAILIQKKDDRARVLAWPVKGADTVKLAEAKARARAAYAYFAGRDAARPMETGVAPPDGLPSGPERSGDLFEGRTRFIVLPLAVPHLPTFGVLQLESPAGLSEQDLVFVNAVVNQVAIALARQAAIDERHAVTEAERQRYEGLVDSLDQAFVWEADARTFQLSYVSARVELLLGYPRWRWTAEPDFWTLCLHPEDAASFERMIRKAALEERDQRCDHRVLTADGQTRWLHTGVHVTVREDGARLQGVSLDITSEKQSESELVGQLAFTRAVTGSLGEGVLAIDLEGRVTFFNPAAEQLLGVSEVAALKRELSELLRIQAADGSDLAPDDWPLRRAIKTGRPVRSDERLFASGSRQPFPVRYTAAPLRRAGDLSGAVLVFQDIIELKRAENRQRFLSDAGVVLASSLERGETLAAVARLAVPSLADACVIDLFDEDGRVERLEPAIADSADRGLAARLRTLAPELDGESSQAKALRTGRPLLVARVHLEEPARPDEVVPRSLMVVPLTARKRMLGAITFVGAESGTPYSEIDLAFAEAVARRAALAIDNAQLFAQAQAAIRARDELLALVSHDLGNPLGNIVMAASLLVQSLPVDAQGLRNRRHAGVIHHAAQRMKRLIEDLLDISSIEAGQLSVESRAQPAAALVEEALEMERPLATAKTLRFEAELPGEDFEVVCDRGRILQVFANLIGNAIKFTPAGGSITVRAERRGPEAWFVVRDTGSGIPARQMPQLFNRFWQAEKTRRHGTGLGLSIAKGIVEAHGGRITVESQPGAGSSFAFSLPARTAGELP
jgi:PAS domain S-box-containing protein